ncbi:MAG: cckA, partial [Phenylobacterium sp.]|nr:cckA [Phenylobacterium sp.]
MAEPQSHERSASGVELRRVDVLTSTAVAFFLLAVAFTAWVALHSSPVLLATLMLLAGLTGVACLGLFVLRGSAEPAADPEVAPERLLEALDEAAAIAVADGRLQAMNRAWREAVGASPRLPKSGSAAASLFAALAAAR